MIIIDLVLVLVLGLEGLVLVLVLSLECLVLVLGLEGQVLVNITVVLSFRKSTTSTLLTM